MNLIDTHAHLYWDSFRKDLDAVIQRSLDAGVSEVINTGVDVETSQAALRQTQQDLSKIPNFFVYSTIGIHPHEAVKYDSDTAIQKDIEKLEQIYRSDTKRVVAVGECGLDYLFYANDLHPNITLQPNKIKQLQKQLFQAQIDLAKKLKLPLIVHCRDDRSQNPGNTETWNEILKMVGDHPAILHCYSGLLPTTNYILPTTNLLISFAATITYPKNEYLREAAKLLPLDRIVLETDCPFLPPQSKRGQRNEPSAVKEIATLIADLKQLSLAEIANQTTRNCKKLFSI